MEMSEILSRIYYGIWAIVESFTPVGIGGQLWKLVVGSIFKF